MSTTDTRTGFRLPWSSDRAPQDEPQPVGADESPEPVADGPEDSTAAASRPAWPVADIVGRASETPDAPAGEPPALVQEPATPPHRRPTKFLADLTAAMRTAAEASREQAIAQFQADTRAVIGTIHETSAEEATGLRTRADEDVAAVRDWSKAEIARIREETDARIAQRRQALEQELEAHAADVERRIEHVQGAVAAYESEMAGFFERLFAETDPSRFAAMAEAMPEPPALDDPVVGHDVPRTIDADTEPQVIADAWPTESDIAIGSVAVDPAEVAIGDGSLEAADGEASGGAVDQEPGTDGDGADPTVDRSAIMAALEAAAEAVVAAEAAAESASQAEEAADLAETAAELLSRRAEDGAAWGDLDAAEAEAALAARLDAGGADEGSFVDRLASLTARATTADADAAPRTSRLMVTGLVSVASIASFKRHLGRVAGVQAVTVSSGPDGEFVFTATHRPEVSFRDIVPSLPGFGARVTHASDDVVNVTAHDPESDG